MKRQLSNMMTASLWFLSCSTLAALSWHLLSCSTLAALSWHLLQHLGSIVVALPLVQIHRSDITCQQVLGIQIQRAPPPHLAAAIGFQTWRLLFASMPGAMEVDDAALLDLSDLDIDEGCGSAQGPPTPTSSNHKCQSSNAEDQAASNKKTAVGRHKGAKGKGKRFCRGCQTNLPVD